MKKESASFLPQAEVDYETVTEFPIDLCTVLAAAQDPKAGAVVLFSGEVRNHSHDKNVSHLVYEAYVPMAKNMIREIIEEANKKWKLHKAICVHRIGRVNVCETAIVVVTSSSHREEAYAANRYIIDRVKHEAPIWKQEFFEDGTHEWGHNCSCHKH
jgi:molybdopterin synthase catalytic subunit